MLQGHSYAILVHPTGGSAASRSTFQGTHGQRHQFLLTPTQRPSSRLCPCIGSFNLYSNDLPVTRDRKFIYADDTAIQGRYFSELECSLSSNMARTSHFGRQLRLKPSTSKTISSVFHMHNTSATRELSVYLDGQRLRHQCHPTYLGVTLDRTLSYREHLTKTAGKLKNRNNLLMKLAGSTWGASAITLRSSALATYRH